MERRLVPVDAAALLAAVTARDEGLVGTYLDLSDGALLRLFDPAVVGRTNDAVEARIDADPDRYAKVPLYGREYRLMTEFVDTVDDDDLARLLDTALGGHSAFRRFDRVLAGWPEERARWETYRADALRRWSVRWMRSLGVEPLWDQVPPDEPAEAPSLVSVALRGAADEVEGAIARTFVTGSEADARALFVRLARELCELAREPFRVRMARDVTRFARLGVEVRREGAAVTVSVRR